MITEVTHHKHVGVTISRDLSWQKHMSRLTIMEINERDDVRFEELHDSDDDGDLNSLVIILC